MESLVSMVIIIYMIIIYHDFLHSLIRGSHVKSDYACTITQHSPLSLYTRYLFPVFSSCFLFHNLPQTYHVTASQTSTGDNKPERRQTVRKNRGTKKKKSVSVLIICICTRALHSFLSLAYCRPGSTGIPQLPNGSFTPFI